MKGCCQTFVEIRLNTFDGPDDSYVRDVRKG